MKKEKPSSAFEIFPADIMTARHTPLANDTVSAGFPSPADDFVDRMLDLNEHLIKNKAATFLVRVRGTSMINAGIHDGDILIVDRSLEASNGKIVIGVVNGEFTVKRIQKRGMDLYLIPENDQFQPIRINEDMDFKIWGVVTYIIHKSP